MANIRFTQTTLIPGEQILYAAERHNFSFVYPLALMLVGLLMVLYPLIVPKEKAEEGAHAYYEQGHNLTFIDTANGTVQRIIHKLPPTMVKWLASANQVRMVVMGFILMSLGIGFLTVTYIKKISIEQVITSKKIIYKKGFVLVDETEMPLNHIEGVRVKQGVIDRIINRGTIQVNGIGMEQLTIRNVAKPAEFRSQAYQAIDVHAK